MAVKEAPDYAEIPELYRDGASFCFESGIMTGDSQHYLRPYDSISRQEFAAVLQRYITLLQKAGKITVSTDTSVNTAFTDASSIAPWAKGCRCVLSDQQADERRQSRRIQSQGTDQVG